MHDRSDYKHGWQLEQDWEKEHGGVKPTHNIWYDKKRRPKDLEKADSDDEDPNKYVIAGAHSDEDDDLPFKCIICRESFINPVVTKCKHYFCEKCFVQHNKKDSKCYACKTQTQGIFFTAKEIIKKMNEASKPVQEKEENSEESD